MSRISQLVHSESIIRAPVHSAASPNTDQVRGSCSYMREDHKPDPGRIRRTQSAWLRWKSYSLLLSRAWNIEIYKAQQGWNFCISVYALVLHDSLVARYTIDGNVEGLQQLFSEGEASPLTVCVEILPNGWVQRRTLLEVRFKFPYIYFDL
jgi:hypothetical protein